MTIPELLVQKACFLTMFMLVLAATAVGVLVLSEQQPGPRQVFHCPFCGVRLDSPVVP